MPKFGFEDEGKLITFTVMDERHYGVLTFIGMHPYLIDEDGAIWLFHGNDVFKVNHKEKKKDK